MAGDDSLITCFVPCLNEEKNILPTLETLHKAAEKLKLRYEALVFDDASTDKTVEKVKACMAEHPDRNIRLIENPRTMGLGYNFVEGAYQGTGEYYILVNGDNAEPEDSLEAILSMMGEADMIIPYFGDLDDRRLLRRRISATFTFLVNTFSGNNIQYYNGSILHRRFNVMRWHPDSEGFAYQSEIVTRVLERGATYKEVKVRNVDRRSGITKAFNVKNFLSVSYSLLQIYLRRVRRFFWPSN